MLIYSRPSLLNQISYISSVIFLLIWLNRYIQIARRCYQATYFLSCFCGNIMWSLFEREKKEIFELHYYTHMS